MDKQEPPTTIKEVGIHIAYMSEAINELKELIRNMSGSFTSKGEHIELVKRVVTLETKLDLMKTTDDVQQGSIDASRRVLNVGLTIAGLALTSLFVYVSWKVGTRG